MTVYIYSALQASEKGEEMYEDIIQFTKNTLREQYNGKSAAEMPRHELCTLCPSATSPSEIIITTVRELADKELSLSEVG